MRAWLKKTRAELVVIRHKAMDWMHALAHIGYFVGVFIEGHGYYTYAAGALALFTLFYLFTGSEEEL